MSDEAKIRIVIDGEAAFVTVGEVTDRIEDLQRKAEGLEETTDEFKRLTAEIELLKKALSDIDVNIDTEDAEESVNSLKTNVSSLKNDLATPNELNVDTTQAQQNIQEVDASIDQIADQPARIDLSTDAADQKIDQLEANIQEVSGKEVTLSVDTTSATAEVNDLKNDVESISNKDITLTADTQEAQVAVDELQTSIDSIGEKDVTIGADTTQASANVEALKTDIDSISEKAVTLGADTSQAQEDISNLQNSIDNVVSDPIPLTADNSQAVNQVKTLEKKISDLKSEPIKPSVDTTDANKKISDLKKDVKDVGKDIEPIKPEVKIENAKNSLGALRKELLDLQKQIDSEDVGSKRFQELESRIATITVTLSQAKDRLGDLGDTISTQLGSPVERIKTSFNLLQEGLSNLDIDKVKTAVSGLGSSLISAVTGPFTKFRKELTGLGTGIGQAASSLLKFDFKGVSTGLSTATVGFRGLGAAIASTGIGALVIGVVALISNFDKLKSIGGPIGALFKGIGGAINFVTGLFKEFSDAVLGTNFKEAEAIEKANIAYEEKTRIIDINTKKVVASLQQQGASQEQLAAAVVSGNEKQVAAINEVIAANAKRLAELEALKRSNKQLSDAEQEELVKYQDIVVQKIELDRQLKESRDNLTQTIYDQSIAEDRVAVLSAKTGSEKIKAQQELIDTTRDGAVARAKAEGKSEEEIQAIILQSNSEKKQLVENYYKEVNKAVSDNRILAAENEVKRLELAKATDEEITAAKINAINVRAAEEEKAAKGNAEKIEKIKLDAEKKIIDAENELRKNKIADIGVDQDLLKIREARLVAEAKTQEEVIAIQKQYAEQKLALETTKLELEKELAIQNTKEGSEERAAIEEQYDQKIIDAKVTAYANYSATRKAQLDQEVTDANDALKKETDSVKIAREKILESSSQVGILGLKANVEAINAEAQKEKDAVNKNFTDLAAIQKTRLAEGEINEIEYNKNIKKLTEDQADALLEIDKQSAEDRKAIAQEAFQSTVQAAQTALNLITEISNFQLEKERTDLETKRTDLENTLADRQAAIEAQYQRELKVAQETGEDTIKAEERRAFALARLDQDGANLQNKLDKQDLELKKKQIKRDRNAALAQIALSNAVSIANAIAAATSASTSAGPAAIAVLAVTLAVFIASIALTIAKANQALKEANSASSALGAGGGGGGDISTPSVSAVSGSIPQAGAPQTSTPTGVNPINPQQGEGASSQNIVINPVVSVIDINAAQQRVDVTETRNTFSIQ